MKGQLDVCSPIVDLSEGQISHIAPILEGGADGGADVCLPHVRAVVVDVVGQALLSPTACRRRTVFFFFLKTPSWIRDTDVRPSPPSGAPRTQHSVSEVLLVERVLHAAAWLPHHL